MLIENCDEECQTEAALASIRVWNDYLPSAVVNSCLDDASRRREGP
jgi:hypothetical protein